MQNEEKQQLSEKTRDMTHTATRITHFRNGYVDS